MSATWVPLGWDSDFFGFGIGRIELEGAGASDLAAAEADARAAGISCLYGALDPADAPATVRVQEAGYLFVEAATTLDLKPDEPAIPRPPGIEVRIGTEADLPAIADMVDRLAGWSRFAVDPRFGPDAARRMQWAWVERAARCRTGEHELVLAEGDDGVAAFISRAPAPEPVIDTVGTTARGSGAARYLVEASRSWAGDRPLLGGPIAARNISALRYVGHCGFRVARVRYLYHRWLDDGPGPRS